MRSTYVKFFAIFMTCAAMSEWVFAANVPKDFLDTQINMCKAVKQQTAPELAKNPPALDAVCTCTMKKYWLDLLPESEWQSLPETTMQNMPKQSDSPEERKEKKDRSKLQAATVHERMAKAEGMCKQ